MLTKTYSAALFGVDGILVTIETKFDDKLPKYEVVGLPDNSVKESNERIYSAIVSSGLKFPYGAIVINLAPADIKKTGSAFDLAMLVGILSAGRVIKGDVSDKCFIGELSLSGEVRGVRGVLCMCIAAARSGIKKVYVPAENAAEASAVAGICGGSPRHIRSKRLACRRAKRSGLCRCQRTGARQARDRDRRGRRTQHSPDRSSRYGQIDAC